MPHSTLTPADAEVIAKPVRSFIAQSVISPLGALAMNCAAPDEGNIHLLAMVGTEQQKERYLRPLVRGDIRSCFAMTEPPPGAGSDPAALMSTARKVPGGWQLNGDKHFITGADGAGFAIVMAKSEWTCWCSARGPGPADRGGRLDTRHRR